MTAPVLMRWTGEAMEPAGPYWAKQADQQWVVGERYAIEVHEERSAASHRHYFASINEAWQTLPEAIAERFPTPEALRKYALIQAGFRDERSIICSSKAEAQRVAAFVRPMDEFAIVSVAGAAVVVLTAKSQSMRAMGKVEFKRSKDAVLEVIAEMLGISYATLSREAA